MLETKNFFVTIRISLKNCRMVRDSENNLLASIMNGQGGEGGERMEGEAREVLCLAGCKF